LDLYLIALARRALRLHEAIIELWEKGLEPEANILARALCEVWIVVRWITNKDKEDRAMRYAGFEAKLIQHIGKVLPKHDPSLKMPRHREHEMIAEAAAEYSSHTSWAGVTLRTMAEEPDTIEKLPSGEPLDATWFYDVLYFFHSCYVHSNALGTRGLTPYVGEPSSMGSRNPKYAKQDRLFTLFSSTGYVTMIFCRLAQVWSLSIGDKIEGEWKGILEQYGSA